MMSWRTTHFCIKTRRTSLEARRAQTKHPEISSSLQNQRENAKELHRRHSESLHPERRAQSRAPRNCLSHTTTYITAMASKTAARNRVMRLTRKYRLIMLAGGACQICGYDKNISSLAFHHVHEKGARLNGHYLINMSIAEAEQEVDRCILVCHNCHNEIHNPELRMDNIKRMAHFIREKLLTLEEAFKFFFPKDKEK